LNQANLQAAQPARLLPDISLLEQAQLSFSDSFLSASSVLVQTLQNIERAAAANEEISRDPLNQVALRLFSKLRCHFYSLVLLEINPDPLGSQFLTEQLWQTAITLTYLLEEADESDLLDYIAASVVQARQLLADVDAQLQEFPEHSGLLALRNKLVSRLAKAPADSASVDVPSSGRWGPPEANTTAKRAAILGLGLLSDPAREMILRVQPASWLDLHLNCIAPPANGSASAPASPNLKLIRNCAHLCLHTTRAFLETVGSDGELTLNSERLNRDLDTLFEWFHYAYKAYVRGVGSSR